MRAPPDEPDPAISSLALDDDSDEEAPADEKDPLGTFPSRSATADTEYY
jgi:hypothetical protein